MRAVGAKFTFSKTLSKFDSLAISLTDEYRIHPTRDYQNGTFTSVIISGIHQINSKFSISAGFQAEVSNPEASHLQYVGSKIFGGLSNAWKNGVHSTIGVQIGSRQFVGLYPLTLTPRSDVYTGVSVSAYSDKISYMGFAPKVSCSFTFNGSNIAFFDYQATDCQIGFTQRF